MQITSSALTVSGAVAHPLSLRWEEVAKMDLEEREMRVDCMGGYRHTDPVRALPLLQLLEMAGASDEATNAMFYSSDGYNETAPLLDLIEREAFLAYSLNGEAESGPKADVDLLPRLVFPGKFGYKWVKWLQRIELVAGEAGHWAQSPGENARTDGKAAYPFPPPPSCCALYIWGRKRLWQPSHR